MKQLRNKHRKRLIVMESVIKVYWKMIRNVWYKALVLIWWCFTNHGNSVPIDYCLHPLDKNDCGLKPTPVFSYYKPGSRCEVEMWRGCPTFNKFPDEVLCSHHCIGKLWGRTDEKDMKMMEVEEGAPFDECNMSMSDTDCGVKEQFKYTFIDGVCIRVAWKGCKSHNMFDDEERCINACNPQTTYNFEDKLEKLPMHDVEVINDILESAMAENMSRAPIMQLKLQMDIDTEGSTETTPKPKTTTAEIAISAKTISTKTEETTKVDETTIIVEEATSQVEETTSIDEEASSRVEETTSIVEETTSPVQDTTSSVQETTSPIEETTTVVQETTSPIEETTSIVEETTSEIVETTVAITEADATTTQATTTIEVTTEGDGSAEEVILT